MIKSLFECSRRANLRGYVGTDNSVIMEKTTMKATIYDMELTGDGFPLSFVCRCDHTNGEVRRINGCSNADCQAISEFFRRA